MTEIIYESGKCLLWDNAKLLAERKNLIVGEKCPVVDACYGTNCLFLDRQLTPEDYRKLTVLREELKSIG